MNNQGQINRADNLLDEIDALCDEEESTMKTPQEITEAADHIQAQLDRLPSFSNDGEDNSESIEEMTSIIRDLRSQADGEEHYSQDVEDFCAGKPSELDDFFN